RLFAAGVCALDFSKLGRRIVTIDSIDKYHARLSVTPRRLDDGIQHLSGVQLPDHFTSARIDQVVLLAALDLRHELVGDSDRDIEGVQFQGILFGIYEFFDIRVIDSKNGHVGARPFASELGYLGGEIV